MFKATTDKKQLASIENQLRLSKRQLDDLHQELRELDAAQITRYTIDNADERLKGSGGVYNDVVYYFLTFAFFLSLNENPYCHVFND